MPQAMLRATAPSSTRPTVLGQLGIYTLPGNHPKTRNPFSSFLPPARAAASSGHCCLGETCSSTQGPVRWDTDPSVRFSRPQAPFLLPFRCLQLNEPIMAQILFLTHPPGVLLTLLRTIFKCAISWLARLICSPFPQMPVHVWP